MSKKLYPEEDIQNIANAIRTLNGSSDSYKVSEMASAIELPENAYYLKSASGNPINITDGEELKCQSAKVTFSPKQSGTGDPSPSNIRPFILWNELNLTRVGVNQWDEEYVVGTIDENGNYSSFGNRIVSKNYIPVVPNTSYRRVKGGGWIYFYDENYSHISHSQPDGGILTTPSTCRYIKFYTAASYGTTYNHDISINYPATDTDYHAYNGQTHIATFPDTIMGGSYDFVSGKGKSEWVVYTYVSSLSWTLDAVGTPFFKTTNNVPNVLLDRRSEILCNKYIGGIVPTSQTSDDFVVGISESGKLRIRDSRYTDTTTFIQSLSDCVICYPITPTDITLTPEDIELLKGSNTVWTDGDTVELEYWSKSNTVPLLNMLSMSTMNISNINNENNGNEVEEIPVEESKESLEEIENIDNSENE